MTPSLPPDAAQERQGNQASYQTAPVSRRPLRILLAEDNSVNQRVAVMTLEKIGHEVSVVAHGQAALQKLQNEEFDVVLMDVQMPIMSGEEATACIRQGERDSGRHLPIIAMTAHAMKGDRERLLRAGMDDYLAKPIQSSELMRVLERFTPGEPFDPPDHELVDRAAALAFMGGDPNILADIAGLFLEDFPKIVAEIQSAVAGRDAMPQPLTPGNPSMQKQQTVARSCRRSSGCWPQHEDRVGGPGATALTGWPQALHRPRRQANTR